MGVQLPVAEEGLGQTVEEGLGFPPCFLAHLPDQHQCLLEVEYLQALVHLVISLVVVT